jgi:dynein heavy chain
LIGLQVRWKETAIDIEEKRKLLVGDVFLCSACISYYGAFSGAYREILVENWIRHCLVFLLNELILL